MGYDWLSMLGSVIALLHPRKVLDITDYPCPDKLLYHYIEGKVWGVTNYPCLVELLHYYITDKVWDITDYPSPMSYCIITSQKKNGI